MVIANVTEKDLVDAFKFTAKTLVNTRPGLFAVSGLKYSVRKSDGELLSMSKVDDNGKETPIDIKNPSPTKTYRVAADSFVMRGGDKVSSLNYVGKEEKVFEFDKDKLGSSDNTEWQYKHFFGLDYGYTNDPTAFVAFAVNPILKEIYIYDEYYKTRMLNCDIAEMIKKKGYAKERIRADCAEPKSNDDLRRLGIARIMPSVKGKDSILNGIAKIQEYKIFVLPKCVYMLKELSSYCWKKDTDENGINEPQDCNNHLCDALRYAFYDVKYFKPINPNTPKRKIKSEEFYRKNHGLNLEDIITTQKRY